jgi:toluene monooxygenase system ferredoxin subunit
VTKRFVCRVADIPRNGMRECKADGGFKVLVANAGDSYFAYQAMCPHQEVPLCEGLYDGERLTCHQHLWQWDIRTGSPLGFAEAPLQYFDVQIEDGAIYIAPPSPLNLTELFIGISRSTLAELNKVAQREEHEAGTTLYHPGDPAEDLYVVDGGRVEFLIGREGHTSPAGFVLRQGEVFGWAALLDKQSTRIAKATCLEKSSLLRMSGQDVLKILQKDPASGFVVMSRLSLLIMRHLRHQA